MTLRILCFIRTKTRTLKEDTEVIGDKEGGVRLDVGDAQLFVFGPLRGMLQLDNCKRIIRLVQLTGGNLMRIFNRHGTIEPCRPPGRRKWKKGRLPL